MSQPDLTQQASAAQTIEQTVLQRRAALNSEQEAQLSKVLFPDTHTDKVELLGKSRQLRPLPVKYSRALNVCLQEFYLRVEKGLSEPGTTDVDLLDQLLSVVDQLSEFYGWDDVKEELKELEKITTGDLQRVVVNQAALQEANDFLLMPLRVLIGMMRHVEIEMALYRNISFGQDSSNTTTAPSTS